MTQETKEKLRKLAKSASLRAGWIAALLIAFIFGLCLAAGDPPPKKNKPAKTPTTEAGEHAGHEGHEAAPTEYTCSMHPNVRSPEPGKCPICGMDLIPVEQKKAGKTGDIDPNKVVTLTPRAKKLARIRTFKVRPLETVAGERRLLGRVDYDETRVKTVTAWTAGRIDRLLVATTGQTVRRYQAIAYIYSPEIYAAQSDLIQAAKQLTRLKGATPLAQNAARAALRSARQRLRLLGVPGGTIKRMERAKQPQRNVAIHSPFRGTVLKRLVDEGNYVQAGTGLYKLADLSRLWVQLDAYESDLPYLKKGQTVQLTVEALPGRKLEGKVTFIDPVVDAKTRTVRVRVEVKNDGSLRPGMFAEAAVEGSKSGGKKHHVAPLVIPATAPLFTGQRSVVYVEVDGADGLSYEARVVSLGPKAGNVYPVVSGLKLGERVVTHGAFALDADLQLRGGHSMMTLEDDETRRKAGPIPDVPAEVTKALAAVVKAYLDAHEALQGDALAPATRAAKALETALAGVSSAMPARLHSAWQRIATLLSAYARRLAVAPGLAQARDHFKGLSDETKLVLQRFGNPLPEMVNLAFCPMANKNRGAEWLQRGKKLRNPYFGSKMHACGEIRAHVPAGGHLKPKPAEPKASTGGGHQH